MTHDGISARANHERQVVRDNDSAMFGGASLLITVSFGKLSIDIGRMKKNTKLADADPKRDRIQLKNSRSTNQRKGGEVRCIEIV